MLTPLSRQVINTLIIAMIVVMGGLVDSVKANDGSNHPADAVLELGVFSPYQLQNENTAIHGLRLNFIYGKNIEVSGLDLGLFNNAGTMTGLQIGMINHVGDLNSSDSGSRSWQLGYVNTVTGDSDGFQFGMFNYVKGSVAGLQVGIVNVVEDSLDEYSAPFLWVFPERTESSGQLGFYNFVGGDMDGRQIGFVNIVKGSLDGWQIGMVNYCEFLDGGQIGIVNIANGWVLPYVHISF